MELRYLDLGGHRFTFVNNFRSTRSGFAHDTEVFLDGKPLSNAKVHYPNRTWEHYSYQTSMARALSNATEALDAAAKSDFMYRKGYDRLTAKRKAELQQELDANERRSLLFDALEEVRKCRPNWAED